VNCPKLLHLQYYIITFQLSLITLHSGKRNTLHQWWTWTCTTCGNGLLSGPWCPWEKTPKMWYENACLADYSRTVLLVLSGASLHFRQQHTNELDKMYNTTMSEW